MPEKNKVLTQEDKSTIDSLIETHAKVLIKKADESVKIGDLIKLIQIRLKLAPGEEDKKELLRLLEKVRRENLPGEEKTKKKNRAAGKKKSGG
ncbi:MAG: hypothetical protein JXA92_02485 [candidate division Zixibacteria bacterium]|nr:hypothetical protein [candidate division Zixibacteria bacterium]